SRQSSRHADRPLIDSRSIRFVTRGSLLAIAISCVLNVSTQAAARDKPDAGARWQTYTTAGSQAYSRGDFAEAEKQFRMALDQSEQLSPQDMRRVEGMQNLAEVYMSVYNPDGAQDLFNDAYNLIQTLRPEDPQVVSSLLNLGDAYFADRNYGQAEEFYKRAVAMAEKIEPGSEPLAGALNDQGNLYYAEEKYDAALPLYQRSLAFRQDINPDSPKLAARLNNLALLTR